MVDTISLSGIRAFGRHGVLPAERRDGQDFVIDVVMEVDCSVAIRTDDVEETVNYAEVAATIVLLVSGEVHQLIETLASRLATTILQGHDTVLGVSVTVHKPNAPVPVPFDDVSVTIGKQRDMPVVISVGANRKRVADTVRAAISELSEMPGLRSVRSSALYLTDPVGGPPQERFVNAVVLARTRLAPRVLLAALHDLEDRHGRTRDVRWGPRTLDLDLIQYGDPSNGTEVRRYQSDLTLPHPLAAERAFVLVPWKSVDPVASLWDGSRVVSLAVILRRMDTSGVYPLDETL